jgi:hypothetical protein
VDLNKLIHKLLFKEDNLQFLDINMEVKDKDNYLFLELVLDQDQLLEDHLD